MIFQYFMFSLINVFVQLITFALMIVILGIFLIDCIANYYVMIKDEKHP